LPSRAPCSAPDRQPHEDSRVALGRERYVTPENAGGQMTFPRSAGE
jgi:hypothetical protein